MAMAWLVAGSMSHGQFAPPSDGSVAFRRDQIPLDAATMSGVSRQMVALARAQAMSTPAGRRDAARMLALALALDPQNSDASELLRSYQQNAPHVGGPAPTAVEMKPLWRIIAWLEDPESGGQGRVLAALLSDVAAVALPDDPRAKKHTGRESAAWDGWVPPLDAYEDRPAAPVDSTESAEPASDGDEPGTPAAPPLANAVVRTVLWQPPPALAAPDATVQNPWLLAPAPLHMQASIQSDDSERKARLRVGASDLEGPVDRLSLLLSQLLAARGERVPPNLHIHITSPQYEAAAMAGLPRHVSAAAAVLASAAVTGRVPDAMILGEVDAKGELTLPKNFWVMLNSLGPGNGRKLVLPAKAIDWLPSLMAMEKTDMFLDHEVLLARDFDHLLALSAKQPDREIAEASVQFADIHGRGKNNKIRDYLANRFVRQRLADLAKQAPWHASAIMLHTQSVGQRPVSISRGALAVELREALRPMSGVSAIAEQGFGGEDVSQESASLGDIYGKCRDAIEKTSAFAARTDQDIVQNARALATKLRTIERGIRVRGEDWNYRFTLQQDLRTLALDYRRMNQQLLGMEAAALGE
jgi:hypothetical protein